MGVGNIVRLYDPRNHQLANYVASIQEAFGMVSFVDCEHASTYTLDTAIRLARLVRVKTGGHIDLAHEYV